jgi:hypothetical protein
MWQHLARLHFLDRTVLFYLESVSHRLLVAAQGHFAALNLLPEIPTYALGLS